MIKATIATIITLISAVLHFGILEADYVFFRLALSATSTHPGLLQFAIATSGSFPALSCVLPLHVSDAQFRVHHRAHRRLRNWTARAFRTNCYLTQLHDHSCLPYKEPRKPPIGLPIYAINF